MSLTRQARAKGTTAYPREEQPLPFFEAFCSHLEDGLQQGSRISSQALHASYLAYVKVKVGHKEGCSPLDTEEEVTLAVGGTRFYKKMSAHAQGRYTPYQGQNKGYYVRVVGLHGRRSVATATRPAEEVPLRRSSRLTLPPVAPSPPTDPSQCLKVLECSGGKGKGVFASRDLPAGLRLCEYKGARLSMERGLAHEAIYTSIGFPPTMLFFHEEKIYVDGHCKGVETVTVQGVPRKRIHLFGVGENVAALFNHKLHNPNCKAVIEGKGINKRCYLETRRQVAKNMELVWTYGDSRKGLDSFMYM